MLQERKEYLQEKIRPIFDTDEFVVGLLNCSTAEDVSSLLGKMGVDITSEEVAEMTEEGNRVISEMKESGEDELDLAQLENVAGGGRVGRWIAVIGGGVVLGAALGFASAACPAFTPAAVKIAAAYSVAGAVWIG